MEKEKPGLVRENKLKRERERSLWPPRPYHSKRLKESMILSLFFQFLEERVPGVGADT